MLKQEEQGIVIIYYLMPNNACDRKKRGSQCTSNTSSQISINSVCDNNTYHLKDLPFLWKAHFFLDEPRGGGGGGAAGFPVGIKQF